MSNQSGDKDNTGRIINPGDEQPPGTPQTGEDLCYRCKGTGRIDGDECTDCGGSGRINVSVGDA